MNTIMELNLTNILLSIIAVAISVIAIKVTFTFNINEYLKSRKINLDNKIKNYCPHAYISIVDDGLKFQSAFISPTGTTNYICQRCQLITYYIDENDELQRIKNLLKNPKKYKKQTKIFEKLLRKGGYI